MDEQCNPFVWVAMCIRPRRDIRHSRLLEFSELCPVVTGECLALLIGVLRSSLVPNLLVLDITDGPAYNIPVEITT